MTMVVTYHSCDRNPEGTKILLNNPWCLFARSACSFVSGWQRPQPARKEFGRKCHRSIAAPGAEVKALFKRTPNLGKPFQTWSVLLKQAYNVDHLMYERPPNVTIVVITQSHLSFVVVLCVWLLRWRHSQQTGCRTNLSKTGVVSLFALTPRRCQRDPLRWLSILFALLHTHTLFVQSDLFLVRGIRLIWS